MQLQRSKSDMHVEANGRRPPPSESPSSGSVGLLQPGVRARHIRLRATAEVKVDARRTDALSGRSI
jgi:hypothetical protein